MENEELVKYSMYDRLWIPQDFVTGSNDINDVIYYLRAEREFEIFKLTTFVTTNLVNFEKTKISRFRSHPAPLSESPGESSHLDHHE